MFISLSANVSKISINSLRHFPHGHRICTWPSKKNYTHAHTQTPNQKEVSVPRAAERLLFLVSSTVTRTKMGVKAFYKVAEIQTKL